MIKKVNLIFLLLGIFLTFGSINSFAFCIHNKTDVSLNVLEYSGGSGWGRFKEILSPGETKCCNWKNHSCNTQGHRDSIVKFSVDIYYGGNTGGRTIPNSHICDLGIKAGGDLVIEGSRGNYRCIPYDY